MLKTSKANDFTLVELMSVVALLAIFAGIAVPSFTNMIANNRLKQLLQSFVPC